MAFRSRQQLLRRVDGVRDVRVEHRKVVVLQKDAGKGAPKPGGSEIGMSCVVHAFVTSCHQDGPFVDVLYPTLSQEPGQHGKRVLVRNLNQLRLLLADDLADTASGFSP